MTHDQENTSSLGQLSQRQRAFVREYMVDRNATQAAIRSGYSKKGAGTAGSRLLQYRAVTGEIARLSEEANEQIGLTRDYVIERLMIEAEGKDADTSASARVSALEKLGKHLGMFEQQHKHDATERLLSIARAFTSSAGSVGIDTFKDDDDDDEAPA